MNSISNPACRAAIVAVIFGLGHAAAAMAQPSQSGSQPDSQPNSQLSGHWKADDTAAGSAAGSPSAILTLEGGTLSWRPKRRARPVCSGSFALQPERPGTVYRNARGDKFVAGALGSFPTFLLKLDPGTCGGSADQWRISFPLAYDRRHMELIEYQNGRPIGSRRYHRID